MMNTKVTREKGKEFSEQWNTELKLCCAAVEQALS